MLLQMAQFSEDFVLSKTRFSLFKIKKMSCMVVYSQDPVCIFTYINCNALAISREMLPALRK